MPPPLLATVLLLLFIETSCTGVVDYRDIQDLGHLQAQSDTPLELNQLLRLRQRLQGRNRRLFLQKRNPAAALPAGNHDVHKLYIMGGHDQDHNNHRVVKNKKRQIQLSLLWQLPNTVKLFNLKSAKTRKIASDSKNCMKKRRIEDIDSSQQRSQENSYFCRFQKRSFWPVAVQLLNPMALNSLVPASHLKNKDMENKEKNYQGEIKKPGGKYLRLQKRKKWPNSLKLFSPHWKTDLENWLKEHAETIKRNQEVRQWFGMIWRTGWGNTKATKNIWESPAKAKPMNKATKIVGDSSAKAKAKAKSKATKKIGGGEWAKLQGWCQFLELDDANS